MNKMQLTAPGSTWVKAILLIVACIISAGIGGGLSRHWGASTYEISYSDFISIMLTAISLLMTVLAIFLAVFGVLGWSSIESRVHEKTEAYLAKLEPVIQKSVEEAIRAKTNELMYEGIEPISESAGRDIGAAAEEQEVK